MARASRLLAGAVAVAMLAAVVGVSETAVGANSEPQQADGATVRSLSVVMNPYLEEGVTVRHLGRIRSVRGLDRAELEVAMRTAPRELMNFTAARGPRDDDLLFAYAVALEGAVVGAHASPLARQAAPGSRRQDAHPRELGQRLARARGLARMALRRVRGAGAAGRQRSTCRWTKGFGADVGVLGPDCDGASALSARILPLCG